MASDYVPQSTCGRIVLLLQLPTWALVFAAAFVLAGVQVSLLDLLLALMSLALLSLPLGRDLRIIERSLQALPASPAVRVFPKRTSSIFIVAAIFAVTFSVGFLGLLALFPKMSFERLAGTVPYGATAFAFLMGFVYSAIDQLAACRSNGC
jgi:hypothetical protein